MERGVQVKDRNLHQNLSSPVLGFPREFVGSWDFSEMGSQTAILATYQNSEKEKTLIGMGILSQKLEEQIEHWTEFFHQQTPFSIERDQIRRALQALGSPSVAELKIRPHLEDDGRYIWKSNYDPISRKSLWKVSVRDIMTKLTEGLLGRAFHFKRQEIPSC